MPQPVAIVSVTNDLTTDQRVDRTCRTLVKSGYDVLLVGRKLRNSKKLGSRMYATHRMQLLFDKGALFYAEYNLRLLIFLLNRRKSLLVSNDLDVLPANYLAFRLAHFFGLRRESSPALLHDCHEYYRGVPELVDRKTVTAVWKLMEDRIFPKLKHVIAVNQSVADLYHQEYGNQITVIRNVPIKKSAREMFPRIELGIREDQKIILYQGAINVDRGLEEAIMAMKYLLSDAVLVIAGIGDIYNKLVSYTSESGLTPKVKFLGQVPFDQLHAYTLMADLGLSIEKDVGVNYHFALPNKLMDYIQAKVPVLVSPFPEMKAIVDQYQVGELLESHDPVILAKQIDRILNDRSRLDFYKANLGMAAEELIWEHEEKKLVLILNS